MRHLIERVFLRALFQAWRLTAVTADRAAKAFENGKLHEEIRKHHNSLGSATKERLVEMAVEMLGMPRAQAEQLRTGALRHQLREARREAQAGGGVLPKGLARMSHAELSTECNRLGISTQDPRRRKGLKVREQMIADITTYCQEVAAQEAYEGYQQRTMEMEQDGWATDDGDGWQNISVPHGAASSASAAGPSVPFDEALAASSIPFATKTLLEQLWNDPTAQEFIMQQDPAMRALLATRRP